MKRALMFLVLLLAVLFSSGAGVYPESPEERHEREKAEVREQLQKFEMMDFGAIKDYKGLKQVEEEIFQIMNEWLARKPVIAHEAWKEGGAFIQQRLADRADSLAGSVRRDVQGQTYADRKKATDAVQLWLLAAQSRRWADYVVRSIENTPESMTVLPDNEWKKYDADSSEPVRVSKNYWIVSDKTKQLVLDEPLYNNVWQTYFEKMLDVAKASESVSAMNAMLNWLEQYKNSKIDSSGKSKLYSIRYHDQGPGPVYNFYLQLKMLPDAERQELDKLIVDLKGELKLSMLRAKEKEADSPCKKMGLEPDIYEMMEELKCTDVAY
ncbi:MAG: hypothetical protein Q7T82_07830 [Armatimonadota bacterium]|nr:hypothetical protein [Armatimonadota bacterium]